MFQRAIDALFPSQCAGCGALGSGFCDACAPRGEAVTVALETLRVRALGGYAGGLRRAILALKDGRRDVARALGERLAAIVPRGALLVPVPTTLVRRRMRGFDGGVLLARFAAQRADATVLEALDRAVNDVQRGRNRRERLAAHGRFCCSARALDGAMLILLDDVVTTGSTLEDCAAALRAAGARVDEAVVVANTQG